MGMLPAEIALVSSYIWPSIVTFSLAFELQHATFPTPSLVAPKISPCSPGIRWIALGFEERRCCAYCPCN